MQSKYRPCIWFEGDAEAAADYYAEVFPDVSVGEKTLYPEGQPDFNKHMEGKLLMAIVTIGGQEFIFLNGGEGFPPSEYFSIEIMCDDQAEVDRYWDRLIADGGTESQCGWIKDKFNHDWQIVPKRYYELMEHPENTTPVMTALYEMQKIIVADLEAAAAVS